MIRNVVQSSDGVELAVFDLGGEGPVLLIAHATGFCGLAYGPMADGLTDHFHCFALDFRAHGESSRPEGELRWRGMADDVAAVLEAVSPREPAFAVGHSMGGAALMLAEQANPGLLNAAWLFEPIFIPGDGSIRQPSPISEKARARRADFSSREEAYERYASRPPLDLLDPRCLRAYVTYGFRDRDDGGVTLACRPEDEAEVFEFHGAGAGQAAVDSGIPVALAASGDGGLPAQLALDAAAESPAFTLFRYDDLTHFGPLQAPDRLAGAAADYLLDRQQGSIDRLKG